MPTQYSFTIYTSAAALPAGWDAIAQPNIFLSKAYLSVLEKAAPENMQCHFIGLFADGKLCGVALAQYLNLSNVATFGQQEEVKFSLRRYIFKKFSSHILFIGNNMLTGQNAYVLADGFAETDALKPMHDALQSLVKSYRKKCIVINVLGVKDFDETEMPDFEAAGFKGFHRFTTQPNMIFSIPQQWESIDGYLADLNTKYRTQYNRSRKKADGITKCKLSVEDIIIYEQRIQELYLTVAGNASFNTFHLPANHFRIFKEELGDDFLLYGYFEGNKLVGFSTLIKNGDDFDTYFLGYDDTIQREKMLYLNMLYDMAAYAIKKKYKHVVFGRSAMEIKSSVGAKAVPVFGVIKHTNPFINRFMGRLFTYFDPKVNWKERNPFK
ncbi:MAG: 8-amino-7-oxononanoate synthase [Flavobacterium sp.]